MYYEKLFDVIRIIVKYLFSNEYMSILLILFVSCKVLKKDEKVLTSNYYFLQRNKADVLT